MKCKKAKILLAPYILGDLADDLKSLSQLEAHLQNCSCCAEEYQSTKQTIGFVEKHKDIFTEVFAEIDLERGNISADRPKNLQPFLRMGTVAACLVIGILTWMVFLNYSKPKILPTNLLSQQVTSVLRASVKVELVKPSGNIEIANDQKIIADNELKTRLINGKHQMVMNIDTSLSIKPLFSNSQLGSLVKLEKGEIYTHVQHDGNPFVVETNSGKAVITGTTFNIKTDSQQTELIVTEGTVIFENENGDVNVKAGQTSSLSASSEPTLPVACDIHSLTAWAAEYDLDAKLSELKLYDDYSWQPPLSTLIPEPINLKEVDYKQWVEEKREWFKKDFPWIFELKNALAKEGIKIGYPELLIETGDVWQFVYIEKFPARFSVSDFKSLLKIATSYGFDKKWLLENISNTKTIQSKSNYKQNANESNIFEQLLKYAGEIDRTSKYLYLADACKYLIETRSLIWFEVNSNQLHLANNQQLEALKLLQQEITIASKCHNELLYYYENLQLSSSCESYNIIKNFVEQIRTVQDIWLNIQALLQNQILLEKDRK